ncbi:hypothetical protein [Gorillibacterium sp. sgz5001074]|uniref:hypothetical protein n=1 Tax=Gorillibacterium sp. sgz5001074 TaxID=3446695 RepID=UPI003F66180E
MIAKADFVRLFVEQYRDRAAGRAGEEQAAASAGDERAVGQAVGGSEPLTVDARSFLRTMGTRTEMAGFIAEAGRLARIVSIREAEAREFLDNANYNVADVYDFLLAKREARRTSVAYRLYKAVIVTCALLSVYGLFQVNLPLALLSATIGGAVYTYRFTQERN